MTPLRFLIYVLLSLAALYASHFLAGVYAELGWMDKPDAGAVMFGFFVVAFWHAFPRKPKRP